MALYSRLSRWLNPARRMQGNPGADGGSPLKLTLGGPRFKVQVEMSRSGKADDPGFDPKPRVRPLSPPASGMPLTRPSGKRSGRSPRGGRSRRGPGSWKKASEPIT